MAPTKILGENECPAYDGTGDAVLDLFFKAVPGTDPTLLRSLLEAAWASSKLETLKVVFNIGNVREGGKKDTPNFLAALWWLWNEKGETDVVLANAAMIAEHTSLGVLCNFLQTCVWDSSDSGLESVVNPYSTAGNAAQKQVIATIREQRKTSARSRRRNETANRLARWANYEEWRRATDDGANKDPGFAFETCCDNVEHVPEGRVLFPLQARFEPDSVGTTVGLRKYGPCGGGKDLTSLRKWRLDVAVKDNRMLQDPRVTSEWVTEEAKAGYAAYISQRDAEYRRVSKARKHKLADEVRRSLASRGLLGGSASSPLMRLKLAVASIFAGGLLDEYKIYKAPREAEGKVASLSGLYAKWCPTPGGRHDNAVCMADAVVAAMLGMWPEALLRDVFEPGSIKLLEGRDEWLGALRKAFSAEEMTKDALEGSKDAGYCEVLRRLSRSKFHKNLLAKIRGAAEIPEHFVGKREPHLINYNRMPSVCREKHWKVFRALDQERFDAYIVQAAKEQIDGKSKAVKTGALKPHGVAAAALRAKPEDGTQKDEIGSIQANLQWLGMVDSVRASRFGAESTHELGAAAPTYDGCSHVLPMADVSASMSGTPMEVSVAMSLLLAESCPKQHPFFGRILTFESKPSFVDVGRFVGSGKLSAETLEGLADGLGDIAERVRLLKRAGWGGSTNVVAAFDLMLRLCQERQVSKQFVANTCLVIFSDMEFDSAAGADSATIMETVRVRFEAAGYAGALPKIVFWNLRSSESVPVGNPDDEGVVLLSGYSSGLLKKFLQILSRGEDSSAAKKRKVENFTPSEMMQKVLSHEIYKRLVIPA